MLPLGEAISIISMVPIWVSIFAFIFLREELGIKKAASTLIGFLGVLCISNTEFLMFNIGFKY